jgi:hypothetical protein
MSLVKRPQIDSIYRTPVLPGDTIGDARAAVAQSITITGSGFAATRTWVKIGGLEPIGITPQPDGEIQIAVPDAQYPPDLDHPLARPIPPGDQLQPGPQLLQVLVQRPGEGVEGGLDRGTTFTETVSQSSNQGVFMLVPGITGLNPPSATSTGTITVNGTRLFQPGLKSYVYVNDVAIEVNPAGPPPPTSTQVTVPLTAVTKTSPPLPSGTYPVRIQVNGALSVDEGTFILLP